MSAQDDYVAAVHAAEAATVAQAQAYRDCETAYQALASGVYAATPGPRASVAVAELEQAIGPHRVAEFLRGRLIALQAAAVVMRPGAPAPSGPEWVAYMTTQIQHAVPDTALASRAG